MMVKLIINYDFSSFYIHHFIKEKIEEKFVHD